MYPEYLVAPMRQDLTDVGFEDLKTAEEVEQAIKSEGTVFVVINSVCGCAAANARPAAKVASQHTKRPAKLITVFAGMEKANFQDENPADVRASIKMAKLYDELQKNNKFESKEDIHSLNVFLTRLLFCYFAEDTNIFEENLFTYSISSHTLPDGSDVNNYMERLFSIFNTPKDKREKLLKFLEEL